MLEGGEAQILGQLTTGEGETQQSQGQASRGRYRHVGRAERLVTACRQVVVGTENH